MHIAGLSKAALFKRFEGKKFRTVQNAFFLPLTVVKISSRYHRSFEQEARTFLTQNTLKDFRNFTNLNKRVVISENFQDDTKAKLKKPDRKYDESSNSSYLNWRMKKYILYTDTTILHKIDFAL